MDPLAWWLSWTGAISGVVGAIVATLAFRYVTTIKKLDLRIEVRKARNDLHQSFAQLVILKGKSMESREKTAAATGKFRSGSLKVWAQQWESDQEHIERIGPQIPTPNVKFDHLGAEALEEKLIELHGLQGWLDEMTSRYNADMAEDENTRTHLREAHLRKIGPG